MNKFSLLLISVLSFLLLSFNNSSAQYNSNDLKYMSGDTPSRFTSSPVHIPTLVNYQSSNKPLNSNAEKRITIIESRNYHTQHVMDTVWKSVAKAGGYPVVILPDSTLDDTAFFANTDVLIVSSGVTTLTEDNYKVLANFLMSGRTAYLQCEYLMSYSTNIYFKKLIDTLGGSFNWISELSDDLGPIIVRGYLSTTPYKTDTVSYFYYGVSGAGNNTVTNFLEKNGQYVGFVFNSPNTSFGQLIGTSDQDWIRIISNPVLLNNILYSLATHSHTVSVNSEINRKFDYTLDQNYPNPFNPVTQINYSLPKQSIINISIYNSIGQVVRHFDNIESAGNHNLSFNGSGLSSGVYFYTLRAVSYDGKQNYSSTKKMILLK